MASIQRIIFRVMFACEVLRGRYDELPSTIMVTNRNIDALVASLQQSSTELDNAKAELAALTASTQDGQEKRLDAIQKACGWDGMLMLGYRSGKEPTIFPYSTFTDKDLAATVYRQGEKLIARLGFIARESNRTYH